MDVEINAEQFDKVIISFSGGKDSTAMALHVFEQGVPPEKMEFWHQCVDGKGKTHTPFFDWPSTEGYVRNVARYLGIKLQWQWRGFGFYGELMKENALSFGIYYQDEGNDSVVCLPPTGRSSPSTRRRWPAKTASLRTRWCSSILKIDVARRVMSNRPDLKGTPEKPTMILWLTGERRQESVARSKYSAAQLHPANTQARIVHHFRPMLEWTEAEVWEIIKRHGIVPHPAYYLGFPRLSCRSCIFFTKNHWATLNDTDPDTVRMLSALECELGFTIDSKLSLPEMVAIGKSSITDDNRHHIYTALSEWTAPVFTSDWQMPDGAFTGGTVSEKRSEDADALCVY